MFDMFSGYKTKKATRNSIPFTDLTTAKFHLAKSRGFYKKLAKLPLLTTMADADVLFYLHESILVLPKTAEYKCPTPRQLNNPDDARYRDCLFNLANWHERLLSPTEAAYYEGPLTADERQKYESPFRTRVLPYMVRKFKQSWFAHPKSAHKHLRLYRFVPPNVIPVRAAAPDNAVGPFELHTNDDGSLVFLAYWLSMSPGQKADFVENVMTS